MKEIQLEYYRLKDRRTIDPLQFGLQCIAQFGVSRFMRACEPTEEHIHRDLMEIGFCLRSPLSLKMRNGTFPVMPGWFFVNQPNVPHCLTSRPNGLYIYYFLVRKPTADNPMLGLPSRESATIWQRLRKLPQTIPAGMRAAQVRELFTRIFQLCDQPNAAWTCVQIRQTVLSLIIMLLELAERPADVPCSTRVQRVVDMVREHPERRFTVDDLAREAALSPTHLINQFRKATGFPPIKFQIECRIQKAKELLRQTDATASDIALRLGFGSLQHFSDTFARIVGATPNKWRAKPGL